MSGIALALATSFYIKLFRCYSVLLFYRAFLDLLQSLGFFSMDSTEYLGLAAELSTLEYTKLILVFESDFTNERADFP
jgi:hypothetical protein